MKTREIILRTSGAIVLALTMVLIPLSQAEATSCPNSKLLFTRCDWEAECDSFYIYPFTIKKYEKVTETQTGCEISRVCSSSCLKRFYNP